MAHGQFAREVQHLHEDLPGAGELGAGRLAHHGGVADHRQPRTGRREQPAERVDGRLLGAALVRRDRRLGRGGALGELRLREAAGPACGTEFGSRIHQENISEWIYHLYAASICVSTSSAAALCSGSLRLPHFGDCTHEGQPLSQGHSAISACASRTRSSKRR